MTINESRLDQYGKLRLAFIANAGQTNQAVRFQIKSGNGTLSFESTGVALVLPVAATRTSQDSETIPDIFQPTKPPGSMSSIAIQLAFENTNSNVLLTGADLLPGIANFFIGNDPHQWHTNVPTYAGLVYHNLYPGIDLKYGGHDGLLKGTYLLAANIDPSIVRWHYAGANELSLDPISGNLTIRAPHGVILTEQSPIAWQTQDGIQTPITVGYQVNTDGTVQFALGTYNPFLPLTIDPGLDYSTYLGGSSNDEGLGIAVDNSGNAYVTGITAGSFPTTGGIFQATFGGGSDVFISKLNAAGNALIYSTYLGGSGSDQGYGIAVDSSGDAYVTGITSGSFPTTGGIIQAVYGGGSDDAFVSKLNPSGSTLLYSTYLGGSGSDQARGIAVDTSGNAYIIGATTSNNFPITPGAFQMAFGGATDDAFVSKLNPTGSALVYSTYIGGSGNEQGLGIAVNGSGNAYLTGSTASSNFPTTPGTAQTIFGGSYDTWVSKLNVTGSALVYSTYLGGSGTDVGLGITVDTSGSAYVVGFTNGSFPTTSGAVQTTYGGGTDDAFVSKLNAAGNALIYSTYLGGSTTDQARGIVVDGSGNAYVTGNSSGGFPTTVGAVQTSFGGGADDAFVSNLNGAASALVYSTYLGGSGSDEGYGIAVDNSGSAYIVGFTYSSNFVTTTGAFQTTFGGGSNPDAFVTKLALAVSHIDTIGIYRSGIFYLRLHNNIGNADLTIGFTAGANPYPIVGDWTGAGFDTVGVFDQSNGQFTLCTANSTASCANVANKKTLVLGVPNDQPLSGRWLVNATNSGVGVFRPSNGLIYLKTALVTGYADYTMVLGIPGDIGLAGDWNGKGFDSPGVYRPSNSTFYLSNKVVNGGVYGDYQVTYGLGGDAPVVGDWIAQGHDGIGLFRQSNGFTYLKNALTTGYADTSFTYGIANDIPVAGHWQATYPPIAPPVSVLIAKTAIPVAPNGSIGGNDPIGD